MDFDVYEKGCSSPKRRSNNVVDNISPDEAVVLSGKKFKDGLFKLLTKECNIGYEDMYKILQFMNEYKL